MKMKTFFLSLKCMFWRSALKATQIVRLRGFMPGIYSWAGNEIGPRIEIRRLSEHSEVYEVTIDTVTDKKTWTGYFDNRTLQLVSHDLERWVAFLPEQKKLLYEGKEFLKHQ